MNVTLARVLKPFLVESPKGTQFFTQNELVWVPQKRLREVEKKGLALPVIFDKDVWGKAIVGEA